MAVSNDPRKTPKLQGLHSILDSGLQSLKDSVFSAGAFTQGGGGFSTIPND